MNIAITGINGFVGKHLTRELKDKGHNVVGLSIEKDAHPEINNLLTEYVSCNLAEEWPSISTPIDSIIHLAGLAAVGPSFDKPQQYINLNSSMVTHMCESYLKSEKKPRVIIVSSGAIYDPHQEMPLSETSNISLSSPYSVSKVLVENQASYYRNRGIECVVVRPFNHVGPGQLPGFLVPDLVEKIISRDSPDSPISVGNLQTKRDYTDVRDVVRAYGLIATKPGKLENELYNICSGKSHSGQETLEKIVQALQVDMPTLNVDSGLIRPNDPEEIIGDNSLLSTELNWKPSYSFEQTIADFVAWRNT